MGLAYVLVLVVPVAVAVVVMAAVAARRTWASRPRGDRPRPPAFALPVLANGGAVQRTEGDVLSLSDLRGHPVVLNFWTPWSDACAREAPLLESAWRTCRETGVVVVGVDVRDFEDNAGAWVRRRGLTYPCISAKNDDVYRAYDLSAVPVTYFIDGAGRVRARIDGEISDVQLLEGIARIETS